VFQTTDHRLLLQVVSDRTGCTPYLDAAHRSPFNSIQHRSSNCLPYGAPDAEATILASAPCAQYRARIHHADGGCTAGKPQEHSRQHITAALTDGRDRSAAVSSGGKHAVDTCRAQQSPRQRVGSGARIRVAAQAIRFFCRCSAKARRCKSWLARLFTADAQYVDARYVNDNVTYGEIHTWDTSGVDPTWTLQSVYVRQPDVTEFGGLVSFYD
jgi:hypothetical protein